MTITTKLYPLKFKPILKDKIWGGSKLRDVLNKDASAVCGESWEISGISGDESVVANGQLTGMSLSELTSTFGSQLLGEEIWQRFGNVFPLLVKFIDANADLSIQVHPNDEQSGGQGKTEMWYVMDAQEGATLLSGFNQVVSKDVLRQAITAGTFEQHLNRISVKTGDTFFIEANQVHTIGKGILIAEIQQSSDITYRLYDFNRKDEHGKKRELHVDQSFEVMRIDTQTGFVDYADDSEVELVRCPEFITDLMKISNRMSLEILSSFSILMAVQGSGMVAYGVEQLDLKMGETVLIPANMEVTLTGNKDLTILKIHIE